MRQRRAWRGGVTGHGNGLASRQAYSDPNVHEAQPNAPRRNSPFVAILGFFFHSVALELREKTGAASPQLGCL